jgi:hypothetical protein
MSNHGSHCEITTFALLRPSRKKPKKREKRPGEKALERYLLIVRIGEFNTLKNQFSRDDDNDL